MRALAVLLFLPLLLLPLGAQPAKQCACRPDCQCVPSDDCGCEQWATPANPTAVVTRRVAAAIVGQVAETIEIKGGGAKLKDVVVYVPKVVQVWVVESFPVELSAPKGGVDYEWTWPKGMEAQPKRGKLTILSAAKGPAEVAVSWANLDIKDGKIVQDPRSAAITVHIGDVQPPKPPDPPVPPPIPVAEGFRVIFVRESAAKMTTEQGHTWNSTAIAAYLNAKCAKDGSQPSWRKLDRDQSADLDAAAIKQLWADSKAQAVAHLPSIVIAVGQSATVYPMPATEAETLALLKSKGGA